MIMATNKLKIQHFRANDLLDNGGKQFEMGKGWCQEFFEIDNSVEEITLNNWQYITILAYIVILS